MLPIQLLALNLINDISCLTIPWDNVDEAYLKRPRKWNASSISKFMLWIGPTSSVFGITTRPMCSFIVSSAPHCLADHFGVDLAAQTGWFVESLWSQTLVIHMIHSPKISIIQSRASWQLTLLITCGIAAGAMIPFTALDEMLGMMSLPAIYITCLVIMILCYMVLATIIKKRLSEGMEHYNNVLISDMATPLFWCVIHSFK